jgi:hypothetical protein
MMRWVSSVLHRLADRFEPERSRRRYRPCRETLEGKILLGPFLLDRDSPGNPPHEITRLHPGSAHVRHLTTEELANLTGARINTGRCIIIHVITQGRIAEAGGKAAQPASSGNLDPEDPGGVELVQTACSEKLDPRDLGGVELVRTANSGILKDPWSV